MGVNENTGDKMKKALKRIWDGPVETKTAEDEIASQEAKQAEINEPETPVAPNKAANDFNNMMKANLLKFQPAAGAADSADDKANSFAPYDAGRKDDIGMMDAAIDNTTDIFSAQTVSADNGVTTISKGTSIVGEIHSDSDVEMLGSMKGNIITKGNVNVSGKVMGDIKGANIDLNSCTVQGNIIAGGMLSIDSESVLVGDIKAENMTIDGRLKGNAQIRNMITCQSSSLILGNVTAAVASINEGAKLQGSMQIVNGQIADIKIAEDESSGWTAKAPSSIPQIGLDK